MVYMDGIKETLIGCASRFIGYGKQLEQDEGQNKDRTKEGKQIEG